MKTKCKLPNFKLKQHWFFFVSHRTLTALSCLKVRFCLTIHLYSRPPDADFVALYITSVSLSINYCPRWVYIGVHWWAIASHTDAKGCRQCHMLRGVTKWRYFTAWDWEHAARAVVDIVLRDYCSLTQAKTLYCWSIFQFRPSYTSVSFWFICFHFISIR